MWLPFVCPPTGDLACNPGMCSDWELNEQPLGLQAGTQSTEPHQPGLEFSSLLVRLQCSDGQYCAGNTKAGYAKQYIQCGHQIHVLKIMHYIIFTNSEISRNTFLPDQDYISFSTTLFFII